MLFFKKICLVLCFKKHKYISIAQRRTQQEQAIADRDEQYKTLRTTLAAEVILILLFILYLFFKNTKSIFHKNIHIYHIVWLM